MCLLLPDCLTEILCNTDSKTAKTAQTARAFSDISYISDSFKLKGRLKAIIGASQSGQLSDSLSDNTNSQTSQGEPMPWVFKTEPSECSMQDIMQASTPVIWTGVRNYQARNFLRDQVQLGDLVLIHHSSCDAVGLAGVATVVQTGFADPTQFDGSSHYFDAKATAEKWPWFAVSVAAVKQFDRVLSLAELRRQPELAAMSLLKKGNRLSIMPVTKTEFDLVLLLSST